MGSIFKTLFMNIFGLCFKTFIEIPSSLHIFLFLGGQMLQITISGTRGANCLYSNFLGPFLRSFFWTFSLLRAFLAENITLEIYILYFVSRWYGGQMLQISGPRGANCLYSHWMDSCSLYARGLSGLWWKFPSFAQYTASTKVSFSNFPCFF